MNSNPEKTSKKDDFLNPPDEIQFTLEGIPSEEHQNKIYDMLMQRDEISWQVILKDLVRSEQMNPWNIDIKLICDKFIQTVKQMEKMNFNVSGKILLASAVMLKMKADRLLTADIHAMDQLIDFVENAEMEMEGTGYDDELEMELLRNEYIPKEKHEFIMPRTPQPRKRKVSIFDLVEALEKALEVKHRRPEKKEVWREVKAPEKKININELMGTVHETIMKLIEGKESIYFHEIIPSDSKEDQIMTFVPILHLTNQRRLDMVQEEHFGPIELFMLSKELPDAVAEGVDPNNEQPVAIDKLMKNAGAGQKKFRN